MTTKDEVRSTVEALKMALKLALEALEETRNALAWFYDSYPQDVTKKGNELLPHVETVLTTIREALASKSKALISVPDGAQSRSDEEQQPAVSDKRSEDKKQWVGLAPADFDWLEQVFASKVSNDFVFADIVCAIEAKLKEKNNG